MRHLLDGVLRRRLATSPDRAWSSGNADPRPMIVGLTVLVVLLTSSAAGDAGAMPSTDAAASDRYMLKRSTRDGTLRYDGHAWSATIFPDGTFKFDDHFVSDIQVRPPWRPIGRTAGPSLGAQLKALVTQGPASSPQPQPDRSPEPRVPRMSPYRPDPSEVCRYPEPCALSAPLLMIEVSGRIDFNDFLLRLSGKDPYRHEKARFLAVTQDLRLRLASEARRRAAQIALKSLDLDLERIVASTAAKGEKLARIEAIAADLDTQTEQGAAARALVRSAQRRVETQRHAHSEQAQSKAQAVPQD